MSRAALTVLILLTLFNASGLVAAENTKIALLIGVDEYEKRGYSNLRYAENDVTQLAAELKKHGFQVTVLVGSGKGESRADKGNIQRFIQASFLPKISTLNKRDMVLVAFAGHGRHQLVAGSEDHFFCPVDAHDGDYKTWVSISEVISEIESHSAAESNLLLVDACRDNPSRGVDGKGFRLKKDAVAVFFSASYNELAYEPDSLKHGLFTHYVLQGLKGGAKNFESNVTWDSLVDYVKTNVTRQSRLLKDRGEIAGIQRPNLVGNLRGESPVLVEQLKVREPTLTNSIGMKLRLIPAGGFTMGSRESVDEIVDRFPIEHLYRDNFKAEHPLHPVTISKPFYMGQYEVTIGEFREFVKATAHRTNAEKGLKADNPLPVNSTNGTWKDSKHAGVTDNHPVTHVSWQDAQAFCRWLGEKENRVVRLPTQAEWEYACRARTTGRYWNSDNPEDLARVGNVPNRGLVPVVEKYDPAGSDDARVFQSFKSITLLTSGSGWGWEADYTNSVVDEVKIVNKTSNTHHFRAGSRTVRVPGKTTRSIRPLLEPRRIPFFIEYFTGSSATGWTIAQILPGSVVEFTFKDKKWKSLLAYQLTDERDGRYMTIQNGASRGDLYVKIDGEKVKLGPGEKRRVRGESMRKSSFIESKDGFKGLAPVGQFTPNPFGLYDVHGNVWEWCEDGFDGLDYSKRIALDPRGPAKSERYAIRGGCYL